MQFLWWKIKVHSLAGLFRVQNRGPAHAVFDRARRVVELEFHR
jgi:hypothetical protein